MSGLESKTKKPSCAGSVFGLGCKNKGAGGTGVVGGGAYAVVKVVGACSCTGTCRQKQIMN